MQRWSNALRARGHRVALLTVEAPQGPHLVGKSIWSSSILRDNRRSLRDQIEADSATLRRSIECFGPDVILAMHLWRVLPPTIHGLASFKIPVVWRFGDEWLKLHYERRRLLAIWRDIGLELPRLDIHTAIVNSGALRHRLEAMGYERRRVTVIPNGVDVSVFRFRLRRPSADGVRLLFVGRCETHKGPAVAVDTVRSLTRVGISSRLLMLLASPQSRRAVDIATLIRPSDPIVVRENVSQGLVAREMRQSDFLLFCSGNRSSRTTIEGCPNVVIEAIATGLPVVACPSEDLLDLLHPGRLSIGAPTLTGAAFAEAIKSVSNSPTKIGALSRRLARHRRQYDLRRIMPKVENVLKRAAGR